MSPVSGQGAGRGEGCQDTRQEATQRKTHGMHAKGLEMCLFGTTYATLCFVYVARYYCLFTCVICLFVCCC